MDAHHELDELLANPECHAILVNALGSTAACCTATMTTSRASSSRRI